MTEHILNFAIGIDDDAIVKNVQQSAEKQIVNQIEVDVLNKIFKTGYYTCTAANIGRDGNVILSKDTELTSFATDIIKQAIADYKDEIIDKAAKMLFESYRRTKAFKDKMDEVE